MVSWEPTPIMVAIVAGIPATISAVAGLVAARHSKRTVRETETGNGKSLGRYVVQLDKRLDVVDARLDLLEQRLIGTEAPFPHRLHPHPGRKKKGMGTDSPDPS